MIQTHTNKSASNYTYKNAVETNAGPMYKIKLKEVIELGHNTRSYNFEKPKDLSWSEGAHTHLAHEIFMVDGHIDKGLVRHMSINTLPEEGYIGVTTRVPGSMSKYKKFMDDMVPGKEMFIFKTQNHMPLRREDKNIVLISMGVGISTMRPYIMRYLDDSRGIKNMTNINVDRGSFVYKDELEGIDQPGFQNIYTDSRTGLFQAVDASVHLTDSLYYLVGSDAFLSEVSRHLLMRGIHKSSIMIDKHVEKREIFNL